MTEPLDVAEMEAWMYGKREQYASQTVGGLRLRLYVGWGRKMERAFYTVTHGSNLKYEGYCGQQAIDCFNGVAGALPLRKPTNGAKK